MKIIKENLYTLDFMNVGYFPYIFPVLSIISIVFAISVITTRNPVISVLFLIGLFFCIALYLIAIGMHFIGLSYLLVYVGAVSILFLFILMLINIRVSELTSETKNSIPLVFMVTIIFENASYLIFKQSLLYNMFLFINNNNQLNIITSIDWENTLIELNHINSIGNIMYTSSAIWLILISIILLLAMVGAIVITLKKKDLLYEDKSFYNNLNSRNTEK